MCMKKNYLNISWENCVLFLGHGDNWVSCNVRGNILQIITLISYIKNVLFKINL